MAAIDPGNYGARYPAHLEPVVAPGPVESFAADVAEAARTICEADSKLFGVGIGEIAVRSADPIQHARDAFMEDLSGHLDVERGLRNILDK